MIKSNSARVDNHSHIIHSDIRHMVEAAKGNGLTEFSITEHVSQFRELRETVRFGSVHTSGRVFSDLKEYEMEFQKFDTENQGMRVWRGLEVDFAPRFESRVSEFVNRAAWDILLCSVHEFDDGRDVERSPSGALDRENAHKRWRNCLKLEQLALESNFIPFDVLAHPVRMSRGLAAFPSEIGELLDELALGAERRKKALELNGNDIQYAPHLVRRLALACSKAGCKVSLGSDAHLPNTVFRNVAEAASLVDEHQLELFSPSSK